MHAKIMLGVALVAGLAIPLQAHAQNCTSFADSIINKFGNIPAGDYGEIQVTMVSNTSDGSQATYGEMPSISLVNGNAGRFRYHPATSTSAAYLDGYLTRFFSNHRFNPNGGFSLSSDPFNPKATDSIYVTIELSGSPGFFIFWQSIYPAGLVPIVIVQGQCQAGMINGAYGNQEFILSLFNPQVVNPIIR